MNLLMRRLGYTFHNPALLKAALRHPSCGGEHFQRLEFLGDRVLGLIMSHWIYQQFPGDSEGDCSKRLAHLVNRHTLVAIAERWDIAKELQYSSSGKGALADAIESLLGAIFLDGGLSAAEHVVNVLWPVQDRMFQPQAEPKTALQEYTQQHGLGLPHYGLISQRGPSHQPVFTARVTIGADQHWEGVGSSKQQAEQQAASMALRSLHTMQPLG